MKVIIAGSRTIADIQYVEEAVKESGFEITEIVSGAARGVDTLGEEYAKKYGIPFVRFPADWNHYGKIAGKMRNVQMGMYADALIAVWDGISRGTQHMIRFTQDQDKPVYIKKVEAVIKLDIGSGGKSSKGNDWLGVDPFVETADVRAFMHNLPYEDNTVSEIYSSHALEHVGRHEIHRILVEWYRVLRSGGTLELLIPDLEWCVRHWLSTKDQVGWNIDIIFGNQNHEGEYHKTGFTVNTIREYVTNAGLIIDSIQYISTHSQQTIQLKAHKE